MRKNVASQVISAHLVSKTDGSDITSGTVTVYVTGDGGTQATGTGTVTHEGNGSWSYVPTQAETNFSHVVFTFTHTSAISVDVQVYPVAYNPGDADGLGLSRLDAAISTRSSHGDPDPSGYLDAAISSRLASASYTTPPTVAEIRTEMEGAAYYLKAVYDAVTGYLDATISSRLASTSYTAPPTVAEIQAEMEENGASVLDTINDLLQTNLDAAVSSRLASASYTAPLDAAGVRTALGMATANLDTQLATIAGYIDTEIAAILAAVDTEIAAIKAKTDNLPADPASEGSLLDAAGVRTALGMATANLDTQIATLATLAKLKAYIQLLARSDGAISTDKATELAEINANEGSGAGGYDPAAESLEAAAAAAFDPATEEVDTGKINGVTIIGTGVSGDEFGPA